MWQHFSLITCEPGHLWQCGPRNVAVMWRNLSPTATLTTAYNSVSAVVETNGSKWSGVSGFTTALCCSTELCAKPWGVRWARAEPLGQQDILFDPRSKGQQPGCVFEKLVSPAGWVQASCGHSFQLKWPNFKELGHKPSQPPTTPRAKTRPDFEHSNYEPHAYKPE